MPRKRQEDKKPLTGYDRICRTRTMALSAQFTALQNALFIESRQLTLTTKFLESKCQTKDFDLFLNPMLYNSN